MSYELRDVSRRYGDGDTAVVAVDGVTLDIDEGEFVVIAGPSGSGKTTLLQLLGGLDRATSGSVLFEGRDLGTVGDRELAELRLGTLGFIFQQFNLVPTLTARQNVEAALAPRGLPGRERIEAARSLLVSVGLGARAAHLPSQLSGGEQQRVAIARALANEPRVLLADEPTGNLDHATGESVLSTLLDLVRDTGLAALIATHNLDLARRLDRIVALEDGRLKSLA